MVRWLSAISGGVILVASLAACSSDASDGSSDASSLPNTNADGGPPTTLPDGAPLPPASDSSAPNCASDLPVAPMALISKGVPAFSSSGDPKGADEGSMQASWYSDSLPAWIAYDLSGATKDQRQNVLVSWYSIHAPCYIDTSQTSGSGRPTSYTIETNDAAGGTIPTANWKQVVSVPVNRYCGAQHYVPLAGANWLRMSVTQSANAKSVDFQMDVQSAPKCASDSWLFMGDSITYMTMTHAFCDVPELVNAAKPAYWPAVINGALGGTSTGSASAPVVQGGTVSVLQDTMKDFPGRFVVLAYGTNDGASGYKMEQLVQEVIAAGKTPVVPHMPWAAQDPQLTQGPMINAQIDALYVKYPQIVKGPDLWELFKDKTTLIPKGDVHPNGDGQEVLRKAWATMMTSVYQ